MSDISVHELKERLDKGTAPLIIDVRETWEYEADHIEARNIPLSTVPSHVAELAEWKDKELVVCCRSGARSGQAVNYLKGQGFKQVRNLTGGMMAWKSNINPRFNV